MVKQGFGFWWFWGLSSLRVDQWASRKLKRHPPQLLRRSQTLPFSEDLKQVLMIWSLKLHSSPDGVPVQQPCDLPQRILVVNGKIIT